MLTSHLKEKEKINNIIKKKKTNKIPSSVKPIGHEILLALHSDIIFDFNGEFILELKLLSNEMNFIIIEDRKFCDI